VRLNKTLLTIALIAVCAVLAGVNISPRLSARQTALLPSQPNITVSIDGAVAKPGLYTLVWGSRVEDLVKLAGGLSAEADLHLVKLADPLDSGKAVFIPTLMAETGTARISINNANATELDALPRVGPAIAQRIIENRPYNSVEDLLNVKGIGSKTLEQIRPFATL
jgi:competence protein ComEA